MAIFTNFAKDIGRSCLCMMVTATKVEAEPIGVMLPPKLAPKITAHQSGELSGVPRPFKIFASMAASGMGAPEHSDTEEDDGVL